MTIRTQRLWQATALDADYHPIVTEPETLCVVEYTYDDVDLRLRSMTGICPAQSAFPFWARISRMDRSQAREFTVQPGQSPTIPIGTGAATRLQLTVNAKGQLVNLEGDFVYPAPGS